MWILLVLNLIGWISRIVIKAAFDWVVFEESVFLPKWVAKLVSIEELRLLITVSIQNDISIFRVRRCSWMTVSVHDRYQINLLFKDFSFHWSAQTWSDLSFVFELRLKTSRIFVFELRRLHLLVSYSLKIWFVWKKINLSAKE